MTFRLFCCMIFLCKGLHLPHNPLLRHFLQVPLKKDPHPFGSGRFFIARKAFWKNQVEGALKGKKGNFGNGIGMLYPRAPAPAHAHTRTHTHERPPEPRPPEPPRKQDRNGRTGTGRRTHGRNTNAAHRGKRTAQNGRKDRRTNTLYWL